MVWEEMSFEKVQDGRHLGYRNRTILAILNLYNAPMPPIKFWLNLTYGLGDVIQRISRWPPWWPAWILERNNFSNSEFLCHSGASHQVLAQSDLQFGRRCSLKNFKMAAMAGCHLGYQNGTILAILSLYVTPTPPIKFWFNLTYGLGGDVV